MNKVAIIAAMHGDEVYGIELRKLFASRYPELAQYVKLIIGNKEAYDKNVRFIDADMNRQYGSEKQSHEQSEIARVHSEISEFGPDYIIDIHTTRRDSGIFFISDTPNPIKQRIYDMLDIDVCIIQDKVVNSSLIGRYSNSVSLEYSLRSISSVTSDVFINALANLVNDEPSNKSNNRKYTVKKLISQNEYLKYKGLKNHDTKDEGIALMVPADMTEMDAEYYGFWCSKE